MIQARILGYTNVLGVRQGYKPLYVKSTPIVDPISKNETLLIETAWTPTPEELDALVNGASIRVGLLCNTHPPIKVDVGEAP
jgi:hypothetical protein